MRKPKRRKTVPLKVKTDAISKWSFRAVTIKGARNWWYAKGQQPCSLCYYFSSIDYNKCLCCPLATREDITENGCCTEWRAVRHISITMNKTDVAPVKEFNEACAAMQAKIATIKTRGRYNVLR